MARLTIHLERGGDLGPSRNAGVVWVPTENADVDRVVEALVTEDPGAVKAALLQILKQWNTPRPAAEGGR